MAWFFVLGTLIASIIFVVRYWIGLYCGGKMLSQIEEDIKLNPPRDEKEIKLFYLRIDNLPPQVRRKYWERTMTLKRTITKALQRTRTNE